MKNIILSVSLLLLLVSCNNNPPSVKINSPKNGDTFTAGQTIEVKATLNDNDALTGEKLIIVANANDTIVNFHYDHFGGQYHLNHSFIGSAHTQYAITVIAYGQGTTTKTVTVQVN